MPTTITLDPTVRDRLTTFGHAGMTHNEIPTRMMDEIEREAFIAEMQRILADSKEDDWVDLEDIDWDEPGEVPPGRRARAARPSARHKDRRP